jgi:hypothetical protein
MVKLIAISLFIHFPSFFWGWKMQSFFLRDCFTENKVALTQSLPSLSKILNFDIHGVHYECSSSSCHYDEVSVLLIHVKQSCTLSESRNLHPLLCNTKIFHSEESFIYLISFSFLFFFFSSAFTQCQTACLMWTLLRSWVHIFIQDWNPFRLNTRQTNDPRAACMILQ